MTQRIPYLKRDFKTTFAAVKEWKVFDGAQGCTPLDIESICLRTDKAPPPLPPVAEPRGPEGPVLIEAWKQMKTWSASRAEAASVAAAKPPSKPKEPEGPLLIEAWKEIQEWRHGQKEKRDRPTIPPFDIQDIPIAMEKIGWHKSSELMLQFFAGRLNYSKTTRDEANAIDQNDKFYASEFVETKRFTLRWLLGYAAVERAFQLLISPDFVRRDYNMHNVHARHQMGEKIGPYAQAKFVGQIDTLAYCCGDIFELHRRFQFQHSPVSMFTFLHSDLGGSLGNFSLYAAVARARVFREDFKPATVAVTHVYVYAKDNYSFNDNPDEPSQYLGHWNKSGVIYVPIPSMVQAMHGLLRGLPEVNTPYNSFMDGLDFAVLLGDKLNEENTYYPVRNRDFRNWQTKFKRGGNILSFSDLKLIALETPVVYHI